MGKSMSGNFVAGEQCQKGEDTSITHPVAHFLDHPPKAMRTRVHLSVLADIAGEVKCRHFSAAHPDERDRGQVSDLLMHNFASASTSKHHKF